MGIIDQVKRIVQTSSYSREETPRITDALGVPLDPVRVEAIANGLVDGTIRPTGTAERVAMMTPDDEFVRGEVPNSLERATRFASAALRTAREVDGGHLPADDRTMLNRMMLDVRYQESARSELDFRAGRTKSTQLSGAKDLLGGSVALDIGRAMKAADDHALSEASSGRIDALPQSVRRNMARHAVLLTTGGSFSDQWNARYGPKPEGAIRVEADVLLATARSARAAQR